MRRALDKWRKLPGTWKLVLPPVVFVALFYLVENTRGYVIWQIHRKAVAERGGWITLKDYRERNPDSGTPDFIDVSYYANWIQTGEDDGINYRGLGNISDSAFANSLEPYIKETIDAGDRPINYPEMVRWIANDENYVYPERSIEQLETGLYITAQFHAINGNGKQFLETVEAMLILDRVLIPVGNIDQDNFMDSNILEIAILLQTPEGISLKNEDLLSFVRLFDEKSLPKSEVTPEEFEFLRIVAIEFLGRHESFSERLRSDNEIAASLNGYVNLPLPQSIKGKTEIYLSRGLGLLFPSGWMNLSKVEISREIDDCRLYPKGPFPTLTRNSPGTLIPKTWELGGMFQDALDAKQNARAKYCLAATGVAWLWFERTRGRSPENLKELYDALPGESDLENLNLPSGIIWEPKSGLIESTTDFNYPINTVRTE